MVIVRKYPLVEKNIYLVWLLYWKSPQDNEVKSLEIKYYHSILNVKNYPGCDINSNNQPGIYYHENKFEGG